MSKAELLRERIAPGVVWDISDTDSPMAGVYRGREAGIEPA